MGQVRFCPVMSSLEAMIIHYRSQTGREPHELVLTSNMHERLRWEMVRMGAVFEIAGQPGSFMQVPLRIDDRMVGR